MIADFRSGSYGDGRVLRDVSHGVLRVRQISQHLIARAGTFIHKHLIYRRTEV